MLVGGSVTVFCGLARGMRSLVSGSGWFSYRFWRSQGRFRDIDPVGSSGTASQAADAASSGRCKQRTLKAADAKSSGSSSCWGEGRAGAMGGGRAGRPTPSRYDRIEAGSVRAAIIFIGPPQSGHSVTSMKNTRASNWHQGRRWGQGWRGDSEWASGWFSSLGTIQARSRALGARLP